MGSLWVGMGWGWGGGGRSPVQELAAQLVCAGGTPAGQLFAEGALSAIINGRLFVRPSVWRTGTRDPEGTPGRSWLCGFGQVPQSL